jgi:hypothetical protein
MDEISECDDRPNRHRMNPAYHPLIESENG